MKIIWLGGKQMSEITEPTYALIKNDGSCAFIGLCDEATSFYSLLERTKGNTDDYDQYFRVVLNIDCAEWMFHCPNHYKEIEEAEECLQLYHQEGSYWISFFLQEINAPFQVEIPKRHRASLKYPMKGIPDVRNHKNSSVYHDFE